MLSMHNCKGVVIIHEYGEPSHYSGLRDYCQRNQIPVEYRSFNVAKRLYLLMRGKRRDTVRGILSDTLWFITALLFPQRLRHQLLVVGMAPFDLSVVPLLRVLSRSRTIYHTSWLYWDGKNVPKKYIIFNKLGKQKWVEFIGDVDAIAVVTPDARDSLATHFPVTKGKTSVVYHAFDPAVFNTIDRSSTETLTVTLLGRLEPYKGVQTVVNLAQKLPGVRFKVIGGGQQSNFVTACARELTNLDYLGFISNKNQLADELKRSDIIILPSQRVPGWEELFGMALIEAMACGCIPLATDHTGPVTILKDTMLADNLLPESDFLQQAMDKILAYQTDPELLERQCAQSQMIAEQYALRRIATIWEEIIRTRII